jgi:hypothetical protein
MAHTRLAGRSTKKARGCRTIVRTSVRAARGRAVRRKYFQSIPTLVESSVGKDETAEESGGRAESDADVSS